MGKLSNFSGLKREITVGEMSRESNFDSAITSVNLVFDNGETFMSSDDLDMFLGDYTMSTYVYNVPNVALSVATLFLNDLKFYWSIRKSDFSKLYNAIYSEYDPISNYNVTEKTTGSDTMTDSNTGTDTTTTAKTGNDTLTHKGTDKQDIDGTKTTKAGISTTTTNGETTATSDNKVSAYDSNTLTLKDSNTTTVAENKISVANSGSDTYTDKTNTTNTKDLTDTNTYNSTITDTVKYGKQNKVLTEYGKTLTRSGNIGVTTSQQMIESEYILRLKYSLKELFVTEFIRTYCY